MLITGEAMYTEQQDVYRNSPYLPLKFSVRLKILFKSIFLKCKQWLTFFWGGAPKSLQMVTAAMKLKDAYSLEGKL